MKKFVRLLLALELFLQNFIFIIPAEALETPQLLINGIKQGEEYLEENDNVYLIERYDNIYLDYSVINDNGEDLYLNILVDDSTIFSAMYPALPSFNINFNQEIMEVKVNLCNDWNCSEQIYDTKTFQIKLAYFAEVENSKIYFTDVNQGNANVYMNENGNLILSDNEVATLTIKGENLIDDVVYYIYGVGSEGKIELLGCDLENGIETVYETDKNLSVYAKVNGIFNDLEVGYVENDKYYNPYQFSFVIYHQLPFEAKLVYTDYLDQSIVYDFQYALSSEYFNADHSLSYYIKGEGYLDKEYTINIQGGVETEIYYNIQKQVNGLELNEGIYVELEDFVLELNTDEYFSNVGYATGYNFSVEIDGEKSVSSVLYNSLGKRAKIKMNIFFGNNTINLSAFAGDGSNYYNENVYEVNQDAFEKYSSIYINIVGENFDDDEEYEYYFEYGNRLDISNTPERQKVILSGTVKGEVLNNAGLILEADNFENYDSPQYNFIVKKGEEIIYSSVATLNLSDTPTLANVLLNTDSKNLYIQSIGSSNLFYIATRNAPLHIVITGLGFEEDETYTFNVVRYKDGVYEKTDKVIFTGKELNEGEAYINYDEKIEDDVETYEFRISCEEVELARSDFYVTFVDSIDFFEDTELYIVDNLNDLIKNIKKNTSVSDFISSLSIVNNGKIKVYDATGTKEIEGNVGTGMIARIMNEYDQSILDLDIVVKGDVSGDGNISITDLVKVKRHLAEVQELDGVYEIAGDVTETGEISITDLVKISRDIAQIEEVE